MEDPVLVDEDNLTGLEVTELLVTQEGESGRFRGEGVFGQKTLLPGPHHQRTDPVGVTEGDHPLTGDVGKDGVGALDDIEDIGHRSDDILEVELLFHPARQRLREDVEDRLHIVLGVEHPLGLLFEVAAHIVVICDVPVVDDPYAVGVVDRKGLSVFDAPPPDGRVTNLTHPEVSHKVFNLLVGGEDIPHQSDPFPVMEDSIVGQESRGILPAVLEGNQPPVEAFNNLFVLN